MYNTRDRLFGPDNETDEEDLDFLDPEARAEALGLTPVSPPPTETKSHVPIEDDYRQAGPVIDASSVKLGVRSQAAPPGHIRLRLAEVARNRGCVNRRGPWVGRVSLMGISRGTGLAHTTVKRLLSHPDQVDMMHFDTAARLCGFLKCQPGDLFLYVPGPKRPIGTPGVPGVALGS